MKNSNSSTVCLGILVADVIGRPIDTVPAPGTLQLVPSITPHIGGCAANTGIGLQTLGIETLVAGKVGRDGFGDFVRAELEKSGARTAIAVDEDTPTSATMVLVQSDAERAFLHCTGANATFELADFDLDLLDGAALLHIAGHGLMPRFDGEQCAQLLQIAREKGVKTSLDTAGAPNEDWCRNLRLCLPFLDYFVPSLHEVQHLFPNASTPETLAARLLEAGVGTIALKMGERGSYVSDGRESHFVAPFSVAALDATGAGDAFAAGFLCGVLQGFDLQTSARLANAAGALCVTRVGTIAGYRSLDKTLQFISQN
ncbi:MAG TPA: carbohydrate kinase family protein [Abditibacterium sp.]